MSFLPVLVLAAVLQCSVVPGEGRTDQLALSLCRLWEDHCTNLRTVDISEHDEDASSRLPPFCRDVADMLKERDAKNCESPLFPDKNEQADDYGRPDHVRGQSPPSDLVSDGPTWCLMGARTTFTTVPRSTQLRQCLNPYELYIELEDWSDVVKYARYDSFSVSASYDLHVSGFSGTAGDGFYLSINNQTDAGYLNGQRFSARETDYDSLDDMSCARWYKGCSWSALNGPYLRPSDRTVWCGFGIYWNPFGGSYRHSLKKSKMMVRPVDFQP
ncbi:hypothetical protein Bbelb_093870 [Branchiostoma belcheri]|nr:hypothetical protein Bbelb_093870 [Branchiostoma belcheri]